MTGPATYRIMSPHMPLNVDQAEMDEDLPPGYPGPGNFYCRPDLIKNVWLK